MPQRDVQWDEPLGLYHGGAFRSPSSATGEHATRLLEDHVDRGIAALEAATGVHVADIEPLPAAPVEVFRTFDADTGELIVLWRVACRQRGERLQ